MPDVCLALLMTLNGSCPTAGLSFNLGIIAPSAGIGLPQWESIPITPDSLRTIERLVKEFLYGGPKPASIHSAESEEVVRARIDEQWEIARRAIDRAKEFNHAVEFGRTSVLFEGHAKPSVFYRLHIDGSYESVESAVTSPDTTLLEKRVLMFGLAPRIYADDPDDGHWVAIGNNALLTYAGIGFVASVDQSRSVDLRNVVTYHIDSAADRLVAAKDLCKLQRQPDARQHEKQP